MEKSSRPISLSILIGAITLYFAPDQELLWLLIPLLMICFFTVLIKEVRNPEKFLIGSLFVVLMYYRIIPLPFVWLHNQGFYFGVSIALTLLIGLAIIGLVLGLIVLLEKLFNRPHHHSH